MPLHWPTFFTRLGSAVVFAAIMMAGLLSFILVENRQWAEWILGSLLLLIHALCIREFFRLVQKVPAPEGASAEKGFDPAVEWIVQIGGAVWFWNGTARSLGCFGASSITLLPVCFVPVLAMLCAMLSKKGSLVNALTALAALLYISLPLTLLQSLNEFAWHYPLALILMIWMNDTMAYLVGSFIGKTPFSKISPKKTWEGTAGGVLLTIIGAGVAAWLIPGQSMAVYLGMAVCAAVAGTAGDLLESKLKRLAGVKDSGTMMPGHGGALDRFDSLLVATPFAFAWVWLVQ